MIEMVAVGLKNGEVIVLSVNGMKLWGKRRDRSGAISDVKLVHIQSPLLSGQISDALRW
jgi:hypothetical protein